MIDMRIYGWFDNVGSAPSHDPGMTVNCPVCEQPFSKDNCCCISVLPSEHDDERRSYFFRAHKACWLTLTVAQQSVFETFPIAQERRARMFALSMSGEPPSPDELAFMDSLN